MRTIQDLSHSIRELPDGGSVVVLDTGALLTPESQAKVAARFSRSILGALPLLEEMFSKGIGQFFETNYKFGYGHKSIAELGDAAVFVHGVSMLCAKAIQDYPLYRGQESSTRYIDFAKQPFANPVKTALGEEVLELWREFYLRGTEELIPELKIRFPQNEGEKDTDYQKAIKARALDIMRAFLPAGCTTNVAWIGDLRSINDHLAVLRNHPLPEVRSVAEAAESALAEKFPNSFSEEKRYPASEKYRRLMGLAHTYLEAEEWPEFELYRNTLDRDLLKKYEVALQTRPIKTELPWSIRECGMLGFEFMLDYGSFRDIQRHRSMVIPMPLLTADLGFEPWYLDELPDRLRAEAEALIQRQLDNYCAIAEPMSTLEESFQLQYYLPMGMRVPIRLLGDLRGLVYMIELRATRYVHATLVKRERQMGDVLTELIPSGIELHMDPEPNRFDVKRGTHDIVKAD